MNFSSKTFLLKTPEIWGEIQGILSSEGFIPVLVGGCVRDYLLTGEVGQDWDVELYHPTVAFNKDHWKSLGKPLSKLGKVSFLSFEVIRLEKGNLQFEFSPPRKEIFLKDWEDKGHSNFSVEFDFKMPFEKAVLRRDFTINAMGIKFLSAKEAELLDPLGGVVHLRDKCLHSVGENFAKDPVRFLRAIRFEIKLQFQMTEELKKILIKMPVKNLSPSYFWSEMQKSNAPLTFLKKVLIWAEDKSELSVPVLGQELNGKWDEIKRVLRDESQQDAWMIALEWIGVSTESWQKFFSLGSESSRRMGRWAQASKEFLKLKPEIFHGEFEEIREKKEFELLFDWYFTTKQLLQKNPDLPLIKMIEEYLPDWVHLYRFGPVKDVKHIDPPFRAKYQVWNLCQRL